MKANKAPFLILTIVIVLVVVAVGLNMTQFLRDPNRMQSVEAPNQKTLDKLRERQKQATSAEGASLADMKNAMNIGPGNIKAALGEVPEIPSILLPSVKSYVPTYEGGNQTSGQWYQGDSYQQTEAENRKAATGD